MHKNLLSEQINLMGANKILLLMKHKENRKILKGILQDNYQIIIPESNKIPKEIFDLVIFDEATFEKYKNKFNNKNKTHEESVINLPVVLITSISIEKLNNEYLKIADEIIQTPATKRQIKYRINNLINHKSRQLYLCNKIYQKLSENSPTGVCVLKGNIIKYFNSAFLEIIEVPRSDILEKNIREIFQSKKIKKYLAENNNKQKISSFKLKNGENKKWVEVYLSSIKYLNIKLNLLILVDITERREAEKKLKYRAYHDELTGLYNRSFLIEEIKRLNTKRQLPISLIMADANGLKLVNDSYGHEKGDQLLIKTAEILKKSCRNEDIIARWGGDEFVILLPQTSHENAEKIYKRIKENCDDSSLLSIALGCAVKENTNQDIYNVLSKAEDNMYENKRTESKSAKSNILDTLLKTLGEKSHETADHARRLEKLALALGDRANLSPSDLDRLSLLAKLHDIGKISISKSILKKEDTLNKKEWKKIKEHPKTGHHIASSSPDFSNIAEGILYHHENWDGSGYPEGIQGKEIPLLARIIRIVDAYDVMTHKRAYDEKKSKKDAIKELNRCAGKQFDPKLVEKFISSLKNRKRFVY